MTCRPPPTTMYSNLESPNDGFTIVWTNSDNSARDVWDISSTGTFFLFLLLISVYTLLMTTLQFWQCCTNDEARDADVSQPAFGKFI